jgi:hypothetical protein
MGNAPGDHTTLGQCNVAPSVFQISWNFKLFFGFFLDLVPFFKSRRKGWILFGWTGGLAMLAVNALFVESFVENHQFDTYLYGLMLMCFFYCFSDVAADGMVVEMSKFEPEDKKGHFNNVPNAEVSHDDGLYRLWHACHVWKKLSTAWTSDPRCVSIAFRVGSWSSSLDALCYCLPFVHWHVDLDSRSANTRGTSRKLLQGCKGAWK